MEPEETAVLRLRAEGRSYRQIARELGLPLTRVYKLAQQALGPDPVGESEAEVATEVADAPHDPAPAPVPLVSHTGYLRGPFRMPTREDLAQPYTMPGPGGTVIVVRGR